MQMGRRTHRDLWDLGEEEASYGHNSGLEKSQTGTYQFVWLCVCHLFVRLWSCCWESAELVIFHTSGAKTTSVCNGVPKVALTVWETLWGHGALEVNGCSSSKNTELRHGFSKNKEHQEQVKPSCWFSSENTYSRDNLKSGMVSQWGVRKLLKCINKSPYSEGVVHFLPSGEEGPHLTLALSLLYRLILVLSFTPRTSKACGFWQGMIRKQWEKNCWPNLHQTEGFKRSGDFDINTLNRSWSKVDWVLQKKKKKKSKVEWDVKDKRYGLFLHCATYAKLSIWHSPRDLWSFWPQH